MSAAVSASAAPSTPPAPPPPPLPMPPPPPPPPPPVTHGFRAAQAVLVSAKVAGGDLSHLRPLSPAWAVLPCGRVAAACVADSGDVVVLGGPKLERRGRLPLGVLLGGNGSVQSLAGAPGLGREGGGCLVVAGGDAGGVVVVDAGEEMLVPMRKKMGEEGGLVRREARVVAQLRALPAGRGYRVDCVAAVECFGGEGGGRRGLAVFASVWDGVTGRIAAWVLPAGCDDGGDVGVEVDGCLLYQAPVGGKILSLRGSWRCGGSAVRVVCAVEDSATGEGSVVAVDAYYHSLAVAIDDIRRASVRPEGFSEEEGRAWQERLQRVVNERCWFATVPTAVNWGMGARGLYGRVLCAVDAGGDWVVFGGEDDCVYGALLDRRVLPLDGNVESTPQAAARHLFTQHGSFVSGVAVRDGMVASAGWDGKLVVAPMVGEGSSVPLHGCRVVEAVVAEDIGPGKTFWRVEWVEPGVMYAATVENVSKRCMLLKVELRTGEEGEDYGSDETAPSPIAVVPFAPDGSTRTIEA